MTARNALATAVDASGAQSRGAETDRRRVGRSAHRHPYENGLVLSGWFRPGARQDDAADIEEDSFEPREEQITRLLALRLAYGSATQRVLQQCDVMCAVTLNPALRPLKRAFRTHAHAERNGTKERQCAGWCT